MQARTYYDARPDEVAYYETPDGVTVRFRENIAEEENDNGTQWSADEYSVMLKCGLTVARKRVAKNMELFIAQAKKMSRKTEKLTLTDIADAIVELGEMLAEQDDALVELAEIIMEE